MSRFYVIQFFIKNNHWNTYNSAAIVPILNVICSSYCGICTEDTSALCLEWADAGGRQGPGCQFFKLKIKALHETKYALVGWTRIVSRLELLLTPSIWWHNSRTFYELLFCRAVSSSFSSRPIVVHNKIHKPTQTYIVLRTMRLQPFWSLAM